MLTSLKWKLFDAYPKMHHRNVSIPEFPLCEDFG